MKKLVFFSVLFVLSCNKGKTGNFNGLLIDYKTNYSADEYDSFFNGFNKKSEFKINKLESVNEITLEFLKILQEFKFIKSGLLVLERKDDQNSKIHKATLINNANLLGIHWMNLMKVTKKRYRRCAFFWEEDNIDNFKELLYNQVAFQKKAQNYINKIGREMLKNYSIRFDDIDCNSGLTRIDKQEFEDRLNNDTWIVKTNF